MKENKKYADNIEYLELVFENCETLKIPRKYILSILFSDYTRHFSRIAMNSISTIEMFNNILFEVAAEVEEDKERILNESFIFSKDDNFSVIDFINRRDITNIAVTHFKGHEEEDFEVSVPWNNENDYYNSYQSTTINKLGDFAATIENPKLPSEEFLNFKKEFLSEFLANGKQEFKKRLYLM